MEPTTVSNYQGYDITLGSDLKFYVDFEGTRRRYDTADSAREAIDRAEKKKDEIGRKKLALSVVDDTGTERKVTGIHAANESILVSPRHDPSYYSGSYFPSTPEVKAVISEILSLKEKASGLERLLETVGIKRDGKGYSIKSVDNLEKRYKEVLPVAETLSSHPIPAKKGFRL